MAESYGQLSAQIGQEIQKLEGLQLQVAAVQQNLRKLLAARAEIEGQLGLSLRGHRNSKGPRQTPASREQSAKVRAFWKANASALEIPFRSSGPIPAKVKAAAATK